jgi:integrase
LIIAWFAEHLKGQLLTSITDEVIEELRALKAEETSEATANRHMAFLRALLRKELGNAAPKVPMYTIEKGEPRWLTKAQFNRLEKELALNPHLADMARFTVSTGLRMRNVTYLTWDRVDLKRRHVWIPASSAKGAKAIPVPLNQDAVDILKRWKDKHEERVFVFRGKPIDDANGAAFKAAAKAAGLHGLRWHDLRHTWASWHVQSGTPLHALQELGAWSSYEMVLVYAHLSSGHLSKYAKAIERRK